MYKIVAESPGVAWKKAVRKVAKSGRKIMDGDKRLRELVNVFLTVKNPCGTDEILKSFADPKMISWMRGNFLSLEPVLNWGYSYGQRFTDFDGINQIELVIEKLTNNPESKSATITLADPAGDVHHTPCIVSIDFKIRSDQLLTTAFFRSQDVGKKIYADIICIGEIAKRIAETIGTKMGELNILIVSLHFYEEDMDKINKLLLRNYEG